MARNETPRVEELRSHLIAAWHWMYQCQNNPRAFANAEISFKAANRVADELREAGELSSEDFERIFHEASQIAKYFS